MTGCTDSAGSTVYTNGIENNSKAASSEEVGTHSGSPSERNSYTYSTDDTSVISSKRVKATKRKRSSLLAARKRQTDTNTSGFVYKDHVEEEGGKHKIYGCAFNPYLKGDSSYLATVCKQDVTIYQLTTDSDSLMPLQVFKDPDTNEEFYTCVWLFHPHSGEHFVAAGGSRGVIRLIQPSFGDSVFAYLGHGGAINELVVHPVDSYLLLSASKDLSLRLWNTKTHQLVCIFGAHGTHRAEVLTADFDDEGNRIVSAGMDHTIKIWGCGKDERVSEAIKLSHDWPLSGGDGGAKHFSSAPSTPTRKSPQKKLPPSNNCSPEKSLNNGVADASTSTAKPKLYMISESAARHKKANGKWFPTVTLFRPEFMTRSVHKNYIDCVRFYGDFVLSKSIENKIDLWKPGSETGTLTYKASDVSADVIKLRSFELNYCTLWFVHFGLSSDLKHLALGNTEGELYLWPLDQDAILGNRPLKPIVLKHHRCNSLIRQCAFSPSGNHLVAVCDNGTVWRWDRVQPSKDVNNS